MTLTYSLDKNDFLQYQLFLATKSERIANKRTRSWIMVSASMFLLGWMFFHSGNLVLGYLFLVFGLVTIIFYPRYQRDQYKEHYAKFIEETYTNRFGQTAHVHFAENSIETSDSTGESKIKLTEIDNIVETGGYFYIALKSGGHLIILKQESLMPQNCVANYNSSA